MQWILFDFSQVSKASAAFGFCLFHHKRLFLGSSRWGTRNAAYPIVFAYLTFKVVYLIICNILSGFQSCTQLGVKTLRSPAKITTGLPSFAKAAKKLGVSTTVAKQLSQLVEHSRKTGKFVLPGVGKLVLVKRKARMSATGQEIKIPAKRVAKFRIMKASRMDVLPRKK